MRDRSSSWLRTKPAVWHNYIGTEHILLGLLREEEGLAARVLESLDITVEEVRAQIAHIIGQGDEVTTGQIPFTPRAKRVLQIALDETLSLGNNYIGTEHILLGLVRENEGVAARILLDFDADAEKVRNEVIGMLSGGEPVRRGDSPEPYAPPSPPIAPEVGEELERLRSEKDAAIEAQRFPEAAELRDRERRLKAATRQLELAWLRRDANELDEGVVDSDSVTLSVSHGPRTRIRMSDLLWSFSPEMITGALLLGIGLFVGWVIWG